MPSLLRAAVALSSCLAAVAQCPPGAPLPLDLAAETTLADQGAAHVRWRTGLDAIAAGDHAAAQQHLFAALEFHPAAPALLLELALLLRGDRDLGPLWAERYVRAASDAQGRCRPDATARKRWTAAPGFEASLQPAQELAAARAAAIAELVRFVDKHKPQGKQNAARAVLVRWAAELLLALGDGAPGMLAAATPGVARTQGAFAPDYDAVGAALVRVLQHKPAADDGGPTTGPRSGPAADAGPVLDRRLRAARILVGLRRQAAFEDLQGPPPPDLQRYAEAGQRVLDEHAAALGAARVWTIAELEALPPPERERFTQEHRDFGRPGIALSATGRYRIETVCGHETLLGVARTIELHHARLVAHYGSDPFLQRPGLVRVVPESADLETEGAPYWWAGGFQSGDRTTVRFAWGNLPGLGRTLTHELTHRFDGVLRPFLPAWYGEGHAQWTAAHYGPMAATQFVEQFLDVGAPAHTFYKGYGGRAKFEQLLRGDAEDYRDNYFAGYSLYAFLRGFPPDRPRYRDALPAYEKNARAGQKDPVGWFTSVFCDGKQGRPSSFDELFADWERFVRGCYEWLDDKKQGNEWVGRYGDRGAEDEAPQVMDEPTWSWARARHEPFFGQDHAVAATLLLHEVGDAEGTVAAGLWATAVDGWRPDTATALLAALRASKGSDFAAAAQAFAVLAGAHFPALAAGEAPLLLAALPKSKALLDALARRAAALLPGAPTAAAALGAEHARLLRCFGLPPPDHLPAGAPPALARHLGGHGFTESSLVDFDDRRVPGLWYPTPDGDLHVGRERPRENTGVLDRAAHQRDAFARTVAWQPPGRYVLRGRVHFTTSFVSGALVFGHVRRDRDLRLHFSSGDFRYAIGKTERRQEGGRVHFHLRGLWERDGRLPDTEPRGSVELSVERAGFDFALHVHGPRVLVEIDGEPLLRYAVHDGTPIEGHVGFAMGMGAIRVQQPTVQRLDGDAGAAAATGLDLAAPSAARLEDLLLLPVRGVPRHPHGTLVLWLPRSDDDWPLARLERAVPALAKLLRTPHEHPQAWLLAAPAGTTPDQLAAAARLLRDVRAEPLPVVPHAVGAPFDGPDPWVLFVDGEGLLRAAAAANDPKLHSKVHRWSRLFRSR